MFIWKPAEIISYDEKTDLFEAVIRRGSLEKVH